MSNRERLSAEELARLRKLSETGSPEPWTAMVEGRDFTAGDSFIMIGREDDRDEDMYISRDSGPAWSADLDLIAQARTFLPRLLDEIERLRASAQREAGEHPDP
jgi:hypothetical protein